MAVLPIMMMMIIMVYYLNHKRRSLVSILSQMNPVHILHPYFFRTYFNLGGRRQRIWLKHYATSRKVAGSITDEAIKFFN
jgi:hypothetical protein